MSDFESYLSHCLDTLEHSRVREAMQYSLMAGGKQASIGSAACLWL